jgi:mono/diheme cytochrome c family protein
MPLHFETTNEDAVRAGNELVNPYQNDDLKADEKLQASIQRGADVYRVFCICCHGATGAGDGPVTKRGFPPPPSLLTGKSSQMKDGQLFHVLTYGQSSMPEFTGQLSADRRWDVINYIRSLQPNVTIDTVNAANQGDPATTETENTTTEHRDNPLETPNQAR